MATMLRQGLFTLANDFARIVVRYPLEVAIAVSVDDLLAEDCLSFIDRVAWNSTAFNVRTALALTLRLDTYPTSRRNGLRDRDIDGTAQAATVGHGVRESGVSRDASITVLQSEHSTWS